MSVLFDCTKYAPRPRYDAPEIIRAAAQGYIKRFAEWDLELADIEHLLRQYDHDGYVLARECERKWGFEPDAQLVEDLDGISTYTAHRAAVAEWVKRYDIQCPFQVGDQVSLVSRGEDIWGEVSRIDAKYAQITVFCQSLGHVREGVGTHGLIVNYEDAKRFGERPIEPEQAAVVVSPTKKGNTVE